MTGEQPTERVAWEPSGAEAKTWSLLVVRDGETTTHPLAATGSIVIGRGKSADVRVDHASVSREHARLHLGPTLRIEDLGSSNGTRVRGEALSAHAPTVIVPDEVIDLGTVLLVVQHRQLTQRLRRACSPALFELRVEEACAREDEFAVARFTIEGTMQTAQLVIASCLSETDLVSVPSATMLEALLLDADPEYAAEVVARATAALDARGVKAKSSLMCCPRDGRDVEKLLARRATKPRPRTARITFVARDEAMLRVHRLIERVADSNLSVVLLGETGVGKEVCAELLHQLSPRAERPFLRLNCAALAESLLESELFGYERGAFTGASGDKAGLLEAASGGTLLLDEIGDMPLSTQVKLLRVLEAKEVLRLGALKPRPVDLRVVAATHHDLLELVSAGRFREDLYYRLNGISIIVPPLRERPLDIEPLATHFIAQYAREPRPTLSPAGVTWLEEHRWPGNIRELRNLIERAVVLCDGSSLEPQHLPLDVRHKISSGLRDEVKELERARIESALAAEGGNQRATARKLGISRGALLRKLEQLGLKAAPRGTPSPFGRNDDQ